jgi:hypothetical protein
MNRTAEKPASLLTAYDNARLLAWDERVWPMFRPAHTRLCLDVAERLAEITAEHARAKKAD